MGELTVYQDRFRRLLQLEESEASSEHRKSAPPIKDVTISWDASDFPKSVAIYRIPKEYMSRLVDASVTLSHPKRGWDSPEIVFSRISDGFLRMYFDEDWVCPTETSHGFEIQIPFCSVNHIRMRSALRMMSWNSQTCRAIVDPESQKVGPSLPVGDIILAEKVMGPNKSQLLAIHMALRDTGVSIIQGPPGCGKSYVATHIVANLVELGGKILVCTPSNSAADHLTSYLAKSEINVLRMKSKKREFEVDSEIHQHTVVGQLWNCPAYQVVKLRVKKNNGTKSDRKFVENYEKLALEQADVIVTTCCSAADKRLADIVFKSVIVDEATQAVEPEVLIPLFRIKIVAVAGKPPMLLPIPPPVRLILIGDHKQLSPVVQSKMAAVGGLDVSMFERLLNVGMPFAQLQIQYRMHPGLARFPSHEFYDGSIQSGVTEKDRQIAQFSFRDPKHPMLLLHVSSGKEDKDRKKSYFNIEESVHVKSVVRWLLDIRNVPASSVAVISPYNAQRDLLKKLLDDTMEISSVDAFQGREKDFIIISAVRSNEEIGFLKDERRMNVMLTRARKGLFIIGNLNTLYFSSSEAWKNLILHMKDLNCIFTPGNSSRFDMESLKPVSFK
jgi:regulator of nonsense transcripts 1